MELEKFLKQHELYPLFSPLFIVINQRPLDTKDHAKIRR
jgi:hypothetical protein